MYAVHWARRCTRDGYKRSKRCHADKRHGCRLLSNQPRHREGVQSGDQLSCCSARMLHITTERHAAMLRPAVRVYGNVSRLYAKADHSYTTPREAVPPGFTQL